MTDAQLGLVLTIPLIVGFSVALNRMGVLQAYSPTIAVAASGIIAAILFFQQ